MHDLLYRSYKNLDLRLNVRLQEPRFCVRFSVWSYLIRYDTDVQSDVIGQDSVTVLILWFLLLGWSYRKSDTILNIYNAKYSLATYICRLTCFLLMLTISWSVHKSRNFVSTLSFWWIQRFVRSFHLHQGSNSRQNLLYMILNSIKYRWELHSKNWFPYNILYQHNLLRKPLTHLIFYIYIESHLLPRNIRSK